MTTPYSPAPQPIHEAPSAGPAVDPNTLIALLHSIGSGVAANGQPWPERHQLRGRQMALADADCSLTGLRVVLEVLLAAERTRQNGELDQYVGDRVMEGLIMAGMGLAAYASERLQPEG
ncbi:hypothetical protein G6052_10355 [Stenotrophomonas maltophilia]|nr:hypothetical protein G6052_10355 [Stenotrophomonas maltophilia]